MSLGISVEQVIKLHDALESAPLLDSGKLEAAVARAYSGIGDMLFYPGVFQQAAVLLHSIVDAHAFLDGNKRTAWASAMLALDSNGIQLRRIDDAEMVEYVVAVSQHVYPISATAVHFVDWAEI